MTFQPIVPLGGFAGWQFLQRTMDNQRDAFDAAPVRQRDVEYFRETIGTIGTAENLVSDRRLLTVALGAYGLDEDIDNRFFIRTVLEEGTQNDGALANRLADTRYREFSEAFGFGNGVIPNSLLDGFGDRVADAYLERQFEIGVGDSNETLRLALTLDRELTDIADRSVSNDTKWLTIMGNEPLRRVFETALGLPDAFGALDIDRQLDTFKDKAARSFGTDDVVDLAQSDLRGEVLRTFLARAQIQDSVDASLSSANVALTLLTVAAG